MAFNPFQDYVNYFRQGITNRLDSAFGSNYQHPVAPQVGSNITFGGNYQRPVTSQAGGNITFGGNNYQSPYSSPLSNTYDEAFISNFNPNVTRGDLGRAVNDPSSFNNERRQRAVYGGLENNNPTVSPEAFRNYSTSGAYRDNNRGTGTEYQHLTDQSLFRDRNPANLRSNLASSTPTYPRQSYSSNKYYQGTQNGVPSFGDTYQNPLEY